MVEILVEFVGGGIDHGREGGCGEGAGFRLGEGQRREAVRFGDHTRAVCLMLVAAALPESPMTALQF